MRTNTEARRKKRQIKLTENKQQKCEHSFGNRTKNENEKFVPMFAIALNLKSVQMLLEKQAVAQNSIYRFSHRIAEKKMQQFSTIQSEMNIFRMFRLLFASFHYIFFSIFFFEIVLSKRRFRTIK